MTPGVHLAQLSSMNPYFTDVKAIRESLNMTQAELAERLGIDRSSLAHMENGRPVPRYIALLLASLVDSLRNRESQHNEAAA